MGFSNHAVQEIGTTSLIARDIETMTTDAPQEPEVLEQDDGSVHTLVTNFGAMLRQPLVASVSSANPMFVRT